jgi:hypothetical protein
VDRNELAANNFRSSPSLASPFVASWSPTASPTSLSDASPSVLPPPPPPPPPHHHHQYQYSRSSSARSHPKPTPTPPSSSKHMTSIVCNEVPTSRARTARYQRVHRPSPPSLISPSSSRPRVHHATAASAAVPVAVDSHNRSFDDMSNESYTSTPLATGSVTASFADGASTPSSKTTTPEEAAPLFDRVYFKDDADPNHRWGLDQVQMDELIRMEMEQWRSKYANHYAHKVHVCMIHTTSIYNRSRSSPIHSY